MSDVIYQYQQAYVPNNGNIFHFWVDCTKEIHDEEAREGGTVRTLYAAPPAPVLRLPEEADTSNLPFAAMGWNACLAEVKRLNSQPAPPEASNEQ